MMEKTNIKWASLSDNAVLSQIGEYLRHERLKQNQTQVKVAENAGINRWTINKIEKGEAISLTSLIQILRALKLMNVFSSFKIENEISPIELAKLEQRKRKRASPNSAYKTNSGENEW